MSFKGKYLDKIVMCDWCDPPAMDVPGFRGKEIDGIVEEICIDCLRDASDLAPACAESTADKPTNETPEEGNHDD